MLAHNLENTCTQDKNHREMTFNITCARTDIYESGFILRTLRDQNNLLKDPIQKAENAGDKIMIFFKVKI